METLIYWLQNNLIELLTAIGTLFAMYFAYRSAKMSETANKAQFSPFIVPTIFYYNKGNERGTQPNSFWFEIENRSEYKNAFAKKVKIIINGSKINNSEWEIKENNSIINNCETINPGQKVTVAKKNIDITNFVPGTVKISYEDILGNKFQTICNLIDCDKNKDNYIDYSWKYKQK